MSYAIDMLLRLVEENTRLKMDVDILNDMNKNMKKDGKTVEINKNCNCPTLEEVEKLKESADLIAESQQKQIDRLLAENDFLKEELKGTTTALLSLKELFSKVKLEKQKKKKEVIYAHAPACEDDTSME